MERASRPAGSRSITRRTGEANMSDQERTVVVDHPDQLWRQSSRRSFLKVLGVGGTILVLPNVFAACRDSDNPTGPSGPIALNLSTDTGILNYAFALEQLEAAFYTAVVASAAFGGMTAEQKEVMTDLRSHEVAHREFLRAALGSNAIGDLSLSDSAVAATIATVDSILKNAEAFEDLGVSAYNGAGKYLADANNLLLAGKIVSVEARHAAAIRDLREGKSLAGTPANTRFAGDDVVNAQGLDVKLEPSAVLTRVGATQLVTTMISIGTQPSITAPTADAPPPATP
ncbi:MAG: ferritin-like domain-containing protein [Gemmatimonadales bacterium]